MINAIANIRVGDVLNHSAKFQPINHNIVRSAPFPPQVDLESLKTLSKTATEKPTKKAS